MEESEEIPIDEWPFDFAALSELLEKRIDGFTPSILQDYFFPSELLIMDPLFNFSIAKKPNAKVEMNELKKLRKRLNTLMWTFTGKLGEHDAEISAALHATMKTVDYSLDETSA